MDNNGNNGYNGSNGNNGNFAEKAVKFFQKMWRFRLKIDRKGTPIVNVSSIFALACLIFAPHMSIAGVVLSLLLGYHINLETDGEDAELEEKWKKTAENVRTTAASMTQTIRTEINKARAESKNAQNQAAAPVQMPGAPVRMPGTAPQAQPQAGSTNQEIMQELEQNADRFTAGNPAATTFHSAYSASAGSVPTLHVEENRGEEPAPSAQNTQGGAM